MTLFDAIFYAAGGTVTMATAALGVIYRQTQSRISAIELAIGKKADEDAISDLADEVKQKVDADEMTRQSRHIDTLTEEIVSSRKDMTGRFEAVRKDMYEGFESIRKDMYAAHIDLASRFSKKDE